MTFAPYFAFEVYNILLGLDLGHARELRAAGEFALGIDMEEPVSFLSVIDTCKNNTLYVKPL